MEIEPLVSFFSALTNKSVDENTPIGLSSAQKARAFSWLQANGISVEPSLLNTKFTIQMLLNRSGVQVNLYKPQVRKTEEVLSDFAVGIDIQLISELFPDSMSIDFVGDEQYSEIFTPREVSYALAKESPKETLAGVFAAKEALIKSGHSAQKLSEIEILPNELGKPVFQNYSISISHSGGYAVALAIPRLKLENNRIAESTNASVVGVALPILQQISGQGTSLIRFKWLCVVNFILIASLYWTFLSNLHSSR